MLAVFFNFGLGEGLLIAIIAVLIFGKDLPEVAGKVFVQVRKLRRAVDDLRRETGIDRDFDRLRRDVRDIEQEARILDPLGDAHGRRPPSASQAIGEPQEVDPAAAEGSAEAEVPPRRPEAAPEES